MAFKRLLFLFCQEMRKISSFLFQNRSTVNLLKDSPEREKKNVPPKGVRKIEKNGIPIGGHENIFVVTKIEMNDTPFVHPENKLEQFFQKRIGQLSRLVRLHRLAFHPSQRD